MGAEEVMFLALLNNGVTLLSALLGNMKKPKYLQAMMFFVLLFCIVSLVLTVITENPFTGTNKAPQPNKYNERIQPIIIIPESFEDTLKKFNDLLKNINPEEIEEKPINNIFC
jgi:hypothetical protein